jgi:ADP-ribose pyrophosphatase
MAAILSTPGFTDEKIHLFLARDLAPAPHNREPDEVIEVVTMPLAEAVRKIESGEIVDGKTICALMMASRKLE